MSRRHATQAGFVALCMVLSGPAISRSETRSAPAAEADEILQLANLTGGLVVHVGCGDGQLTAALRANERITVHGLSRDPGDVAQTRRTIQAADVYGPASAALWTGRGLPYVENLVNLLVVEEAADVSDDEALRVLTPNGVLLTRAGGTWKKTVKPLPGDTDEWTHYLHDATGNAVSHDDQVAPPRHLQWLGSPRWSRHHDRMASMSALVSTGGRLFYIMDEGSRVSIQLPASWKLIARDAYNGSILWKRPIERWQSHLWPLKSGPTQLARRLVAIEDEVFVTLGLEAPVTLVDARTGETIRVFEEAKGAEEILVTNGTLLVLANEGRHPLADFAPLHNTGDQGRVAREFAWNEKPRKVMAFDVETGQKLWDTRSVVAPLSLTSNGNQVLFHDGEKVVCLDRPSGNELWTSDAAGRRSKVTFNFGPRLVLYEDVVLFAGGDRKMRALDVTTGQQLWSAAHDQSGYQSPEDLLVAGGLVWSAPTTKTADTGKFTGRDPRTGEIRKEFSPGVETYWFHHRCYIAKATDRFLIPSRTGIEFVDFNKEQWDINHWVRGGCLYGAMPCNGLLYAPPHNCACYPEAKLYGFNALAPTSQTRAKVELTPDGQRLQKGPAFGESIGVANRDVDWPTYRRSMARTAFAGTTLPGTLNAVWDVAPGSRLSSPVAANGRVFVSQIDAHTVHSISADTGRTAWTYTTGGRVDSPPTIEQGRVLFGSADGSVYCLRANDGVLIWRYQVAPSDRRLMAFEQLESVWPVHGSILVQGDVVFAVAGRSNFLDGGLTLVRLDLASGEKLSQTAIDETDPTTGKNMQDGLEVLQMAVGLPDILSSNGDAVFMRSQKFDLTGKRMGIGPNSGDFAGQAAVHGGSDAHMFAPMGFLDDTWFHRSYWVFGRSFAGGHAGYYQAARFAPAGRILVCDDRKVFGFGRKPEYLKWTTTLEHQLFSADREAPVVPESAKKRQRRGKTAAMVHVEKSASLNPAGKALAVAAWVRPLKPNGVVVAHGGPQNGYAIAIKGGKPQFHVRSADVLTTVTGPRRVSNRWAHIVGLINADNQVELYVDGKLAGTAKSDPVAADPAQALEIGADAGSGVGEYQSPAGLTGIIDEVRVFHGSLGAADVQSLFTGDAPEKGELVGAWTFDGGKAGDTSGRGNHGRNDGGKFVDGRQGKAVQFAAVAGGNGSQSRTFVQHDWTTDIPLLARAMILTRGRTEDDRVIYVAGPPDIMDEEETFKRLTESDPAVQKLLAEQDAALDGHQGGLIRVVSGEDGSTLQEIKTDFLPVWDGMAAADGRLFVTTTDGRVVCYGE